MTEDLGNHLAHHGEAWGPSNGSALTPEDRVEGHRRADAGDEGDDLEQRRLYSDAGLHLAGRISGQPSFLARPC